MVVSNILDFKVHFLALLVNIAGLNLTKLCSIDAFRDKDKGVIFGVKGQGHSMTKAQRSEAYGT